MAENKQTKKLLVVEDDKEIARLIELRLKSEGFDVLWMNKGLDALEKFSSYDPDLVILDLMLDDLDGYEICRRIRKNSNVPIIMLTAKSTELDQVLGIATGADHYITKPFSLNVLVAKIRGLLRRAHQFSAPVKPKDHINYGNMSINRKARSVQRGERRIHLTVKEFELLWLLMSNPGRVFSREDLFIKVWKRKTLVDCRTVDVHINKLRKKIEEKPFSASMIRTIHKVGYSFDPMV